MKRIERNTYNSLRKSITADTINVEIPVEYTHEGRQGIHEMLTIEKHMRASMICWNSIINGYVIHYVPTVDEYTEAQRMEQEAQDIDEVMNTLPKSNRTWNGYEKPAETTETEETAAPADDPEVVTLAPAENAQVWDENGDIITPDTDTEEEEEENTMTKVERIIKWFEEHEDVFNDCIEELDGYNGYLGDDRYYSMDELNELYHDTDPIELLNRAYFGYDAETWHTDAHGEKEYGPFNPNRDYFTFNGYGNFVSADYKDYSDRLDEYFIEALNENRDHIWTVEQNDELREMLESLDDDDSDDDEETEGE